MPVIVIFVEGADTEPAKVPVYVVESKDHASLICEGMKESDYASLDFSFKECTRSDLGKFAIWATMIVDARNGVYGNVVSGVHDMIDGAYSIMSGRNAFRVAPASESTGEAAQVKETHPGPAGENDDELLPAKQILRLLPDHFTGYVKLNRFLDDHPEIRQKRSGQRRSACIHGIAQALLVSRDSTPTDEQIDAYLIGAEQRKAEIDAQRDRK